MCIAPGSSLLIVLVFCNSLLENAESLPSSVSTPKSKDDEKRRSNLVDETFLEQKDVLLEMLENKLKEVKQSRKKKKKRESSDESEREILPKQVDVKLKANGISAVGETDLLLKLGHSGTNILDFEATGISNFGKTQLNIGLGNGHLNIPGLSNLFKGNEFGSEKFNETNANFESADSEYLRNKRKKSNESLALNEATDNILEDSDYLSNRRKLSNTQNESSLLNETTNNILKNLPENNVNDTSSASQNKEINVTSPANAASVINEVVTTDNSSLNEVNLDAKSEKPEDGSIKKLVVASDGKEPSATEAVLSGSSAALIELVPTRTNVSPSAVSQSPVTVVVSVVS